MNFLILFLCMIGLVSAHPTGAPDGICGDPDLTPIHSRPPIDHQLQAPPYTVTASKRSYEPKDTINVVISGKDGALFKGYAVGVMNKDGQWIGSWITQKGHNHQLKDCPVITHDNNVHKSQVALKWEAPEAEPGNANFIVTVVKDYNNGWIRVPVTYESEK